MSTGSSNSKEEREKRSVETEAEREREVVYVVTRKERGFTLDKERSHRATRREKEKTAPWG